MGVSEIIQVPEDDFNVIKKTEDCVVVDCCNFVYKIKEMDFDDQLTCFDTFVVQAFATEYQQMGIDWELSNVTIDGKTFRVEKRQKLELLDSSKISYEEAVIESSILRRRVEKRLEFPRIFAQIHAVRGFKHFNKLVMARKHASDLSDFAIFDGQVVILGESNWFLGLLKHDSQLSTVDTQRVVPVETKYGDFYFAVQGLFKRSSAIGSALQSRFNWWLFSNEVCDLDSFRKHMYVELEEMATNNLKVLATKSHQALKTRRDYGNVYAEMKKLGLLDAKHSRKALNESAKA